MASPSVLECRRGEVVPQLAKALHVAGLGGNGRSGDGLGAIKTLAAIGYVEVPHDIECVAFGEQRDSPISNYLDRYEQDGIVYHCDAWHRPIQMGHITRWEYDADGMHDFLLRCRALVIDEVTPWHLDIACLAAERAIEQLRSRGESYDQQAQLKIVLANLPESRRPADLVDILAA